MNFNTLLDIISKPAQVKPKHINIILSWYHNTWRKKKNHLVTSCVQIVKYIKNNYSEVFHESKILFVTVTQLVFIELTKLAVRQRCWKTQYFTGLYKMQNHRSSISLIEVNKEQNWEFCFSVHLTATLITAREEATSILEMDIRTRGEELNFSMTDILLLGLITPILLR